MFQTQGSLVGPISVHFRGSITYAGALGGLRSHIMALLWNLNDFPHFLWMNNTIEYSGLYWLIIFLMNIPDFVWIEFWIELFLGPIQWKNEFSLRIGKG